MWLIMGIYVAEAALHPLSLMQSIAAGTNSSFLRIISEDTTFIEEWLRSTLGTIIIQDVDQH